MKEIAAIAIDLLTAPFRKDTVTNVVAELEKGVDRLFKIAADRIARADELRDRAESLRSEAVNHEAEADRALRIADRFVSLIR